MIVFCRRCRKLRLTNTLDSALTATPLSSYSTEFHVALQQMVPIARAVPANTSSMATIAAVSAYRYVVQGVEIEVSARVCVFALAAVRDASAQGGNQTGVDLQYPWETMPSRYHDHVMDVAPFAVDVFPATNADWLQFARATAYAPRDAHNYLRDWPTGTRYRAGWDRKPVVRSHFALWARVVHRIAHVAHCMQTWVSLEDARVYCAFRGKRLLNEWEWAVIVSAGHEGRVYPWGNVWNASCVPTPVRSRDMAATGPADVDAHRCGASADGVLDLLGNTYTWLNEFRDDHTRAAVMRGSAYYAPAGAQSWYWRAPLTIDRHAKYLLGAPALDRSAVIGVRCAADVTS